MTALPLIAPKPFAEFGADEFHAHVTAMYQLRTKGRAKAGPAVAGLTVSRTKSGKLSVRRTKGRTFAWVSMKEIALLAAAAKCSQAELWNEFKRRDFIIADRFEAERIYANIKEIPWDGSKQLKKGSATA